ncbi:MAG: 4Fe-4S cluster-binding domain-containing protein [Bacilli bacterium]|nr:4Fe-4S cluster-binding domain-containing protein [Bacilli bacterium]
MKIRGLNDYDIVNYKDPTLFIAFPYCNFKCDKDYGTQICQNSKLIKEPIIDIANDYIFTLYDTNPLTKGILCAGLEPFDSFYLLQEFISEFRETHSDLVIIYTGYRELEIHSKVEQLKKLGNLIIKFGRYIPNAASRYDNILGVTLASDNQYAKYYE